MDSFYYLYMDKVIIADDYIFMFDFGHGTRQYTAGKRSPDQTLFEGEWNREVGRRIVDALRELGLDCRILVPEDEDISLQERCNRANKLMKENPNKKCRYISIHINAGPGSGWSDATGMSVYVSRNASAESVRLAHCIYDAAEEFKLKGNRSVPSERVWRANFKVLVGTNMPAVLVENLFMTNKKEVEFLKSENGKNIIVNMYTVAICKYFGVPYAVCEAKVS